MKRLLLLSAVTIAICVAAISVSRSDTPPNAGTGSDAPPEPITGSAVIPNPGSETLRHDPFTPYDIGDPTTAWTYDQLTADEKARVDALRSRTGLDSVANAYGAAVVERSQAAAASAAASQLNAGDLSNGVIP